MIIIDFVWLGINNTNVANIFWKNTLSRSLAEVKHFRNTLDVNCVSSFHGWSFSYSEQYVWSVSSCPPLFCPANKLSLSCVVLGALWDNGIPDAEASSQLHKERNIWVFFLLVNLIPGALLSALRKTQKVIGFNTQESGLMVVGDAVLHVRFACHLNLFSWLWSNLFAHVLSLLVPELGKGWQSWAVCSSQFGVEPSFSPGEQHHHICYLQCWTPSECFLSSQSSPFAVLVNANLSDTRFLIFGNRK